MGSVSTTVSFVTFALDRKMYALPRSAVERVVPAGRMTPLPEAADVVVGLMDCSGGIVPVVDTRKRLLLPEREAESSDQLVVVETKGHLVALKVDSVRGIVHYPEKDVAPGEKGVSSVEGVIRLRDGTMLIHDLDEFLFQPAEQTPDQAMAAHSKVTPRAVFP